MISSSTNTAGAVIAFRPAMPGSQGLISWISMFLNSTG